jgi:hypothetical protein
MVSMERIVRPHVPVDTSPSKMTPKCRDPGQNSVLKFQAPPGMAKYAAQLQGASQHLNPAPSNPPQYPKSQEKTRNSSWAYAYKRYMTKKEKEISKSDGDNIKDGVVQENKEASQSGLVGGSGLVAPSSGLGGSGGGTPQGEPTLT